MARSKRSDSRRPARPAAAAASPPQTAASPPQAADREPAPKSSHEASDQGRSGAGQRGQVRPRDPARLADLARRILQDRPEPSHIRKHQAEIHEQTLMISRSIDRPNFTRVGREDLARMIRMYDERFFQGQVLPLAQAEGITFGLSSRMTRVAGKLVTHYPQGGRNGRRRFELVLSSTLLFQTFEDVDRPVEVTGHRCRDRLEAMQRVAEHELVHLIEMLVWNSGNCSQPRFQSIAHGYFRHTDYQHDLITQQERAATKFNIRVGDTVAFELEGKRMRGRVNRITRRATVLVPDRGGQRFSDGNHYVRYYVPLEKLMRVR